MSYRNHLPLLLLVVLAGCKSRNNDNYFTGTVEYAYTYSSDSINTDSLAGARPAKGLFRYDGSTYQSRFEGAGTFTYYYSGRLNKCIVEAGDTKKYACEDYGMATDSVLSVKDYTTDEQVLGYACRILEMQKKNSFVKYYYATGLKMSKATYQSHKAYNWDIYGENANGGLVLKLEHRFKLFTMKGVASKIEEQKRNFRALEINDSLFTGICKY